MFRRLRIGLPLAACMFVLVGATSAPEAQVQLTIEVSGKGTVTAGGRRVECRASCTRSSTVSTFSVNAGTVVLKARAARTWKFTAWSRACRGSKPTCVLHVQRTTRVTATFVPPGARANPIPLGKTADAGGGWRFRVVSVKPNATDEVLAVTNQFGEKVNTPPPPGAQDFMVLLAATYTRGGNGDLIVLLNNLRAMGAHNAWYDLNEDRCGRLPKPQFVDDTGGSSVSSGTTVTGNVCWQIASNDAATLQMTYRYLTTQVWFALH